MYMGAVSDKDAPIILTAAYILARRAGTSSRYSTGETPPIKAEQPGLCSHLGSTWTRGNISTRIWTRALQPVQEEVSSSRFHRAQTVSGRQPFPDPRIFLLGAEISTPAKVLSYAYIFARRQCFVYTPIFWEGAYILCIRQYFGRRQYFWGAPKFLRGANILYIRQYFQETPIFCTFANIFRETPIFWEGANIFLIRLFFWEAPIFWGANILWICLILLLQIFVYIFSIYFMHLSMRQYFWRNCFNLRFKIDIVVMIIWSIVIIINFVLTL